MGTNSFLPHLAFFLVVAATVSPLSAAAEAPADTAFFESKIRPVLVKHCYECHSTESGKSKGGLLLDTLSGTRTGGETGPAVVPGKPEESLLLTAISHKDPDLEMPPRKPKLAAGVIADFEQWIKAGAPDPRQGPAKVLAERPPVDLESGRKFWAYRKPVAATPPPVKDAAWARRDLDRFVLAKLEQEGIAPSPDTSPTLLLRRVYFDLIGLPPTPKQTAEFNKAAASDLDAALATVVDDLLGSPEFGVRWGRHWLDVARFAESNGRESNLIFPHAWRYRDYVIDAFNANVPYDRFIAEQIAGDLLPAKDDAERARLLIATGFLAFGAKGLNEMNKAQFAADLADEQVDTVTRAITASSVACARCHDHKTEPFAMEDYYAMAGIFKSTKTYYGTWIDSENNNDSQLIRLPKLPGQLIPNKPIPEQRVAQLKADRDKLNREEKEQNEMVAKANLEGRDISGDFFKLLSNILRIYWSRGGIEGRLATVDDKGRPLPLCMGAGEQRRVQDSQLYDRGEIAHPVKAVPRGYPRVFAIPDAKAPPADQSGRLELAQWLTSPEHPLTARVMANRVWHHLLGSGIVRTVDNFGFSGERPTHPELLDHLALRFTDEGWSVKSLIREVVLSRTYRQSSAYRADCFERDPDNQMLWRAHKRRLDAEIIRDSMLAVAGTLDTSRRPGSLAAELDGQSASLIAFNKTVPADLDGSRHRSIYLPIIRDHLPDVLELFDFAEPSLVKGDREITNVPMQALYLMNGPFVQDQAAALAQRIIKEKPDLEGRIRRTFSLCFNRNPDATEQKLAKEFFLNMTSAASESELMTLYCQSLLATAEFRHID